MVQRLGLVLVSKFVLSMRISLTLSSSSDLQCVMAAQVQVFWSRCGARVWYFKYFCLLYVVARGEANAITHSCHVCVDIVAFCGVLH